MWTLSPLSEWQPSHQQSWLWCRCLCRHPAGALSFAHATPQILQPTLPKTLQMMSIPFITWPQTHAKGWPTSPTWAPSGAGENKCAPEAITSKQHHHGFLIERAGAELVACLNDAQATKAIKKAKVYHKNTTSVLQQAQWDNVLALECKAKAAK